MQERYDSLTNSVKESTIIEPSVSAPATGKKVSIPDVFNSPNSTPTSSPTHTVTPRNGVGVASTGRESPVPSPRTRRKVAEGSPPVPSPKTARKVRLKQEVVSDLHHQAVGNEQEQLKNGQPQALGNGQQSPRALRNGRQSPREMGDGNVN